MSVIFGIFGKKGREIDPEWLQQMQANHGYRNPDRSAHWQNARVGLGNLLIYNTPESFHELLPWHDTETGHVICCDARIDNREELARLFDIPEGTIGEISDSQWFLKAYRRWGSGCLNRLRGDFSVAVYHENEHRLFLARDQFGMRPLFYLDHPEYFLFSSEISAILALPFAPQEANLPWLLHFLLKVDRKEFDTFYQDFRILPPGHFLNISDGNSVVEKYWELAIPEQLKLKDDKDYIAEYRRLFERAVAVRSRSAYPVGAELSGGLDSSSIVAVAQKNMQGKPENLHVFSRVLPAGYTDQGHKTEQDETPEIEKVCDFCGIRELHRVTLEHQRITQNIDHVLNILRMPCFSNYPVYNLNMIIEAEQAGVRTILSGHGGDQMVTNPAYFVYPEYRRNKEFLTLYHDIRAKGAPNQMPVLSSLKYLMGIRHGSGNQKEKRGRMEKLNRMGLDPGLVRRFGLDRLYRQSREEAIFSPSGADDLISRICARHMNERIESTTLVAAFSGIDFRYPMFDVDLIRFYLSLPDGLKYKHRTGRYIHRMAMSGMLPEEIRLRKDKRGSINPGLSLLFSNDAVCVRDTLRKSLSDQDGLTRYLFDIDTIKTILQIKPHHLIENKSLINKFFQLVPYRKKIENIFG